MPEELQVTPHADGEPRIPMTEEDRKERQRLYEQTRLELIESARENAKAYDKALLTLSSAFLGGSLAFVDKVVPLESNTPKMLLYFSWGLFALAIVLTLSSFLYGLLQFPTLSNAAERFFLKGELDAWNVSEQVQRVTLWYSTACGAAFSAAVILLVAFVSINLMERETIKPEHDKVIPGIVFPKPPSPNTPGVPATPNSPSPTPGVQPGPPDKVVPG